MEQAIKEDIGDKMKTTTYKPGNLVERLIETASEKFWETGYTVIRPPKHVVPFEGCIYIAKPHTRGFSCYYVGVPLQHLRHSISNNPQTD